MHQSPIPTADPAPLLPPASFRAILAVAAQIERAKVEIKTIAFAAHRAGDFALVEQILDKWRSDPPETVLAWLEHQITSGGAAHV